MIIAVTGGRKYRAYGRVVSVLDAAVERLGMTLLVHGMCPTGLDCRAEAWAEEAGFPSWPLPAEWERYGLAAGPIRNQDMVDIGLDACIAFPGKRGTQNMIDLCRQANVRVIEIDRC